jgi:hypothetical protein
VRNGSIDFNATIRRGARVAAAIGSVLAVAVPAIAAASAGAQSFDQPDRVLVSTSGNSSELVQSVDIGTAPGQVETVVMSLPPKGQPLQSGDGLSPSSEVELTTDCSTELPKCVGSPYSYDPTVDARLILTSSADPTGSGGTATVMAQETGRTCTHEQHHCTLVFPFPDSPFAVSPPAPPCASADGGCRLNLVISAYNPDATVGADKLIVGEDEPDCCGITKQDKGRVNAVRLRPDVGDDPVGEVNTYSSGPLVGSVPVRDTVSEGKTVVFSQRLGRLRKHEQLAVSGDMTTDISALRYNRVLINSRVILADSRNATERSADVKKVEELSGEIAEPNGFNCTKDPPTNPCRTRKAGVAHLIRNSDNTLYVNLVVSSTPAKSGQAQQGEEVTIYPGGTLRVVHYPASRFG